MAVVCYYLFDKVYCLAPYVFSVLSQNPGEQSLRERPWGKPLHLDKKET